MLDKNGTWAPRPSPGPHKLRECLPLILIIRNRLKYALTRKEVISILMQRYVKVDHVVRTDETFPCGLMDVISLEKTGENFRVLLDTKGRFALHSIRLKKPNSSFVRSNEHNLAPRAFLILLLMMVALFDIQILSLKSMIR
jgi:small subunit ribosomal protein S4e